MKYIKNFESVNRSPKIGDYVILKEISSVIGRIIDISKSFTYYIKFIGNSNITDRRTFSTDELKYWSENKKELEIYINEQKYNL